MCSGFAGLRLAHLFLHGYLSAAATADISKGSPVVEMKPPNHNRLLLILLVGTALVARYVYFTSRHTILDDAFITFRFAANVLHGQGFAFNPGESVYGASSPLFTVLSAAILFVSSKEALPLIVTFIGALSLIGFVVALWHSLPLSLWARSIMAVGVLSYPRIFYASVGGMEECFILFLMGLSVVACQSSRPIWLGIICALLFVTKIDTLAWIACILVVDSLLHRSLAWKPLTTALIASVPWCIASLLMFGSVIPHTVAAKQIAYLHPPGLNPLDAVLFTVPDAFADNPLVVSLYGLVVYGTLGIALVRIVERKEIIFLVFPVYCLAYTTLLLFSGTSLGLWERWTVPHWGMFLVTLAYLFHRSASGSTIPSNQHLKPSLLITVLVLHLGGLATAFIYPMQTSPDPVSSREVGQWLRDNAREGESVMLEPIGLIGYISELYVHDFIGLVTPGVTQARRTSAFSNRWYVRYIRKSRPTYIVLRSLELRDNEFMYGGYGDSIFLPQESMWFKEHYHLAYLTSGGRDEQQLIVFANSHHGAGSDPPDEGM